MTTSLSYISVLTISSFLLFVSVASASPSLTVSTSPGSMNLALDGEGSASSHVVKVADVSFSTTNQDGLAVTITSGNLSNMDGETSISFQVTLVEDGTTPPAPAVFTTPSGQNYQFSTNTPGSHVKDLYIYYTPATLQDPGTYNGQLNVSAIDN